MPNEYDDKGNYTYPEEFNPETKEWLDGHDEQRAEWEREYGAAQSRWEAHKAQVAHMAAMVIEPVEGSSEDDEAPMQASQPEESEGTLADDETLAELREKLGGTGE